MPNEEELRVCPRCNEAKPVRTGFRWGYSKQYGRRIPYHYCKPCADELRVEAAERKKAGDTEDRRKKSSPRKEAKAAGSVTYFTGRPCSRGHVSPRYTGSGSCVECKREDEAKRDPEYDRDYYQKNRDKIIARAKEWSDANPGAVLKRVSEWQKNNPDRVAVNQLRWRRDNTELAYERSRASIAKKPDHYATLNRENAARRRDAIPDDPALIPTSVDLAALRDKQCDACVHCLKPLGGGGHLDHKLPVVRGGKHVLENLQWLCAWCNQSKGSKTDDEFRDWLCRSTIPTPRRRRGNLACESLPTEPNSQGQLNIP